MLNFLNYTIMKKIIIALIGMFFAVNVSAAEATASERINELRTEQGALQDQAIHCDILQALEIYKEIEAMDRKIEAMIPALVSERESLRDKALACGNDVVTAMSIMKKVVSIDNLLEELGYEEPADDADVDE